MLLRSDFGVMPLELGGISPLRDMILVARQCNATSIVFEVPCGQRPDQTWHQAVLHHGEDPEILFATTDRQNKFDADYVISEMNDFTLDGKSYPVPQCKEALFSLAQQIDTDVGALVRTLLEEIARAAGEADGEVVRFPDLSFLPDMEDRRFRMWMLDAVDAWLAKEIVFEVRTAGRATLSYPSAFLLRRIGEKRGRVTLSSGAPDVKTLFRGFDTACAQLRACGIGALCVPTSKGWEQTAVRFYMQRK